MMRSQMIAKVRAITFDDFFTLRYPIGEEKDIIYSILEELKREGVGVDSEEFLKRYFKEDALYRKKLTETLRESLLDDIVSNALRTCGYESRSVVRTIGKAVDFGLATRRAKWFPNAKRTLATLRKRGYTLGLISNTHWRISESLRKEFEQFFDVTTLSYEHGYAKPHPSIFIATVDRLRVSPNQCLHVGDDPVADIQGAKSAGMKTAFIKRKGVRTDADIEIGRISELGKLL
jgi:HAD superfamily hydrolase (TIGR01662 family)